MDRAALNQLTKQFFKAYTGFLVTFVHDGKIIKGRIKDAKITQKNAIITLNHLRSTGEIDVRSYSVSKISDFVVLKDCV